MVVRGMLAHHGSPVACIASHAWVLSTSGFKKAMIGSAGAAATTLASTPASNMLPDVDAPWRARGCAGKAAQVAVTLQGAKSDA